MQIPNDSMRQQKKQQRQKQKQKQRQQQKQYYIANAKVLLYVL